MGDASSRWVSLVDPLDDLDRRDFFREPDNVTRGVTLSMPLGDFYREPEDVTRGLTLLDNTPGIGAQDASWALRTPASLAYDFPGSSNHQRKTHRRELKRAQRAAQHKAPVGQAQRRAGKLRQPPSRGTIKGRDQRRR